MRAGCVYAAANHEEASMWQRLGMALVVVCVVGCDKGGSKGPAPKIDTPRGVADGIMQAFKDRSAAEAVALLPSEDQLKQTFDCPQMLDRLKQRKDSADKDFTQAPKDMTIELGAFDKFGTEEKLYKVNQEVDGCKVKAPVTVHTSKLELRMTKDGKTDFDNETWTFLKFGDEEKWYYFK
jgi:hypothetical protein